MSTKPALKSSPRLVVRPRAVRRSKKPLSVVDQVRAAFAPEARLATLLGCLLGGFVPCASYVVAHLELRFSGAFLPTALAVLIVAGGLLFSAKTVYGWGTQAFQSGGKALGFVMLLELTMVGAQTHWLGLGALALLVGINAISTGCTLSLQQRI